jgi:hypothetical protein
MSQSRQRGRVVLTPVSLSAPPSFGQGCVRAGGSWRAHPAHADAAQLRGLLQARRTVGAVCRPSRQAACAAARWPHTLVVRRPGV